MEPEFLLRLAETNLDRGELMAAAAALGAALERGPATTRVQAQGLLQRLRAAAPAEDAALAARLRELAARARGEVIAPAPSFAPAVDGDPLGTSSQTLTVLRRIAGSPELLERLRALTGEGSPGEPSLPVLEVAARLLDTDLDVRSTASAALDLVARAAGATRANLVLADPARTSFGRPGDPDAPPVASQAVLEEVARAQTSLLLQDAALDRRFGGSESVQSLGLRGVLATPVLDGQELVAVLWLEGPAGQFGPREQGLVETLAGLIGPGLSRARRAEATRAALTRTTRLLESERAAVRRLSEPLLLGNSRAIKALRALLERVGPTPHTVLIEGESGSGKELVARTLHALSPRAEAPFVAENLGALSETLGEAELFGHVRGAFTGADQDRAGLFQLADGGTLLLDEVGEAEPGLQVKLLRALEQREVRPVGAEAPVRCDVRILAATHRDLLGEVGAGRFREDLYYRLAVVKVRVPPLRERAEDIPLLLEHFLARAAGELGREPPQVPPELLARLVAHAWPGNVRELQAWATRHVLTGAVETDRPGQAGSEGAVSGEDGLAISLQLGDTPRELREARTSFDRAYIAMVLQRTQGNVSVAARVLGLNRSHLSTLVSRYRLKGS